MLYKNLTVNEVRNYSTLVLHAKSVDRVIRIMQQQLDEALSLQDMADIACFSPYHFNRVFGMITGIPPTQFLYSLRLQQAKHMLLTTQLNVTDICFEVGYNSLGTFTRRFTELVGVSPTKLRTLHEDPALFLQEPQCHRFVHPGCDHPQKGCLTGEVYGKDAFSGFIFVGMFPTRIPQSQPAGCTILTTPGPYRISSIERGRYYVFSAAYTHSFEPEYIGVGRAPVLITGEPPGAHMDITLRPVSITDPPILIAAPYLFTRYAGSIKRATD